ncbi:hypothetical protein ACOSQ4_005684 [Xanthoceras sorbifolium]
MSSRSDELSSIQSSLGNGEFPEVSSPKGVKKWKRLARGRTVSQGNSVEGTVLKKRGLVQDLVDIESCKKVRCDSSDDIKSFTKGHIDSVVKGDDGVLWRFTGFYGESRQDLRHFSWSLLQRLMGLSGLPWIIGGDFNEILRSEEKLGGLVRSHRAMDSFREVIDDCNLIDMGFKGSSFTWCNRQDGQNLIQERLERFFM